MTFLVESTEEVVDLRPTFRASRVAFLLLAFGIGLSTLTPLCQALMYLMRSFPLHRAVTSPAWNWGIIAPSRFVLFIGALLLLNRWRDGRWLFHSLFLFVIQGYLFGIWFSDNAQALGVAGANAPKNLEWIWVLTNALFLVGILCISWLAWDVCKRYHSPESEPLYRAVRGCASIGLSLWTFFLLNQVQRQGTFELRIGALLARSVAGFFAVMICAHACSVSSRELGRLETEIKNRDKDVFPSASDSW